MINYIIYEDEREYRKQYISVILKLRGKGQEGYRIIEIDHYDEEIRQELNDIIGKKIFLLDIEVPGKSGLDLARQIRREGDWESQLIVVTTHEQLRGASFAGRLLMLDFVSKYDDCENNLKESLVVAFDILTKHKSLKFLIEGELYQIPYNDILYIEKKQEENACTIITRKEEIDVKESIGKINEKLDSRFYRSHRSCIVNMHNITSVDFNNSIIKFGRKEINLLSRDKKKDLKDKLCASQIGDEYSTEIMEETTSGELVELYCAA